MDVSWVVFAFYKQPSQVPSPGFTETWLKLVAVHNKTGPWHDCVRVVSCGDSPYGSIAGST